jgi:3D (Asp-Asp-Asp) domain-containing protein
MKQIKPIAQILALLAMCYLLWSIHSIKRDVKQIKEVYMDTVKVTMYTTDPKQTDSSPYTTASGFRLDKKNPKKHRIIAVSRDIKAKLKFGDHVKILGAGKYSGVYAVEDVMNKRFKNRIDILINPKDRPTSFDSIRIVYL